MLTLLLIAFAILRAHGAPLSGGLETDPTVLHTLIFGIQPRSDGSEVGMRTLYDIIRSCLLTIAACVYSSIHQNIPDPNATIWERLQIRAKITVFALIAPEAMIWWAMRQRFGAIDIAKRVNDLDLGLDWTQMHGHFAQMGGLVCKDSKHVIYPPTLIQLLEQGLVDLEQLQLIRKEDIEDKSKGDILSKGLVTFQTTWFVFECLARLQQKLPLLELEVVTLAFAILNIITFALWWHKPLNVLRPIYVHIRSISPACPSKPVPLSSMTDVQKPVDDSMVAAVMAAGTAVPIKEEDDLADTPSQQPSGPSTVPKSDIDGGQADEPAVGPPQSEISDKDAAGEEMKNPILVWLDGSILLTWLIKKPLFTVLTPLLNLLIDSDVEEGSTHVSMFYGLDIPADKINIVLVLSGSVGIIFGAIHFISWNAAFATHTEMLLWRISSVILVAEPALLMVSFGGIPLVDEMDTGNGSSGFWLSALKSILMSLVVFGAGVAGLVGPIAYVFSRFCVLVLALLALRTVPSRAWDIVPWTSYIPHL